MNNNAAAEVVTSSFTFTAALLADLPEVVGDIHECNLDRVEAEWLLGLVADFDFWSVAQRVASDARRARTNKMIAACG